MHIMYMVPHYLLLALAALALTMGFIYVLSDDKDVSDEMLETESVAESIVSFQRLKKRSARDVSPIRKRVVRLHAESSIPASSL
jgi:hypothetical protein